MQDIWNERYGRQEFIYGTKPNNFLKEELTKLKPGRILFPAEGEGRNAVYAASLGWETEAFDQSTEGQKKAQQLANQKSVTINYIIQSLGEWNPLPDQYDCIAFISVHMPPELRQQVHQAAIRALKPGGTLILEAFTINQLPRTSGGPKTPEMLFTMDQIKSDFSNLVSVKMSETQVLLDEGPLHQGLADVIQMMGIKPS
ncbi:MAG: methyltransferase domain-containing protein [Lentimicrobiaceae bacterium]|jgi:2-polyprenyl-3-methyl-5-hydroxy-6-metoxy-1,4-benzoquinol methylase